MLKDFFYTFLSAIAGVFIGVLWSTWRANSKEKKNQKARAALIETVQDIVQLVTQASQQFQSGQPNFPLGIQRASALCDRISEFRDKTLRGEIEGFISHCSHYNSKIIVVNSAYMTTLVTGHSAAALAPYSTMMVEHLQKILGWAKTVIEKLKKENNKAMQPIPVAVTPPACARVASSTSMADLYVQQKK